MLCLYRKLPDHDVDEIDLTEGKKQPFTQEEEESLDAEKLQDGNDVPLENV